MIIMRQFYVERLSLAKTLTGIQTARPVSVLETCVHVT